MFNNQSQLPLYRQLVTLIENQINTGDLKPGQRIPSENELCDLYLVSRTTVRQALNELSMRGKIIRVKGRGTFIPNFSASKPYDGLFGFTGEMKYIKQVRILNKIISFEVVLPDSETSQMLGLKVDEAVIKLERARFIENEGVAGVDLRFLPFNRFSSILDEDLENNSLYNILRSKHNTFPSRAIHEVCGMGCPAKYADILELKVGKPVTHYKDVVFDQNNIPFDFGENFYRSDRYQYRIEISRNNQTKPKN